MGKDKLSKSEIRKLEKEHGGSRDNARGRQRQSDDIRKTRDNESARTAPRRNHEDNEEWVQIHKSGR